MSQNIYVIGYYSHEESKYDYLTNEKQFSEKQLKAVIENATVDVVRRMVNQKDSYIHGYDDIHDEVVKVLCKTYGFKEVEVTSTWSVFGWPSIFIKTDWKGQRDKNLDDLTDKIRNAGFSGKHDSLLEKITDE